MAEKKDGTGFRQAGFAAVAALIGAVLGSAVQQYLNINLERMRRFDTWRRDAYVRYLEALEKNRLAESKIFASAAPNLTDASREELRGHAARLKDEWEYEQGTATLVLAIFGESEVVHELAEHWRRTENGRRCEGDGWKTNLNFYKKLREKAMVGEPNLSDSDLAELTIRCTP